MLPQKEKKTFIIFCTCGCGNGFEFNEFDGQIFVSSFSSDFYNKQRILFQNTKEKLKEVLLVRNHKLNILKEIITTKENLEDLLKYLEQFELINEKSDNYAYLRASKFEFDFDEKNKYIDYSLELVGQKKNIKDILFEKNHRKYDVCLSKKEVEKLKISIKKVLEG